jgi:hypothetical protein
MKGKWSKDEQDICCMRDLLSSVMSYLLCEYNYCFPFGLLTLTNHQSRVTSPAFDINLEDSDKFSSVRIGNEV